MTKRIIALFLACILAIPLLSFHVSANELYEATWYDLLEYDSVTNGSNFFSYSSTYNVVLKLPVTQNLYYIDAVVTATYAPTVTAVFGSKSSALTVDQVGDSNTYRIYGALPSGNYSSLRLLFSGTGTTNYCSLLSCNVSSSSVLSYPDSATIYVKPSSSTYVTQSSAGSSALVQFTTTTSESGKQLTCWYGYVYFNNWTDYDFVDVYMRISAYTVDSIEIDIGGQTIPFEVSYLNTVTPPEEDENPSDTYGIYYPPSYFDIVVRADLRGLDRTITESDPIMKVRGTYYNAHSYQYFSVDDYIGYVASNNVDYVPYFLRNIWDSVTSGFSDVVNWFTTVNTNIVDWFTTVNSNLGSWFDTQFTHLTDIRAKLTTLVLGTSDGFNDADEFNDNIATQETQIDDMINDIATAPTVSYGDVDTSLGKVNDLLRPADYSYYTMLSAMIFDNQMIRELIFASVIFGLLGFLLFGKKG